MSTKELNKTQLDNIAAGFPSKGTSGETYKDPSGVTFEGESTFIPNKTNFIHPPLPKLPTPPPAPTKQ